MSRPHALLRIGFSYEKTLGMRRLTNTPTDVAIGPDGVLHVLSRGEGLVFLRHLSQDDDDLGAFNFLGGGGQVGGTTYVKGGSFTWPATMVMDSDTNLWVADEATNKISCVTLEGEVKAQWGESGQDEGQLDRPSGIALAPDGSVFVVDTLNHRVQRFTRDGKFLMGWGRFGSAPGEFNMPWGVAVDELGGVYVSDWLNHRVQKFDAEGRFAFQFGSQGAEDGQFNRPAGVTIDADGDIYVADWGNHRVQLFSSEGRFVEKFIGDATLSKQARGYMMTNIVALRLREMTALEPQKRLRWPVSVRVDDQGRMYAVDYGSHRIQVYRKEAIPLGPDGIAPPLESPSLYTQF